MESWYFFSIIALTFFGVQRFLYKVSAEWNCDTVTTTITFMITVSALGVLLFCISNERLDHAAYLLTVSAINGSAFVIGTMSTIEALKYTSGNVVYPLTRLGTVIAVVFSILYFGDTPSASQYSGIIIAVAVIIFYARHENNAVTHSAAVRRGISLALLALICGAVAAISSKFAAVHVDAYAFIALSYGTGTLLAYPLGRLIQKKRSRNNRNKSMIVGVLIGIINFIGFLFLMKALSEGPLSLIVPLTGMHFVIAVVLSTLIFRERITIVKSAAIAMTVVSVVLMR